MYSRPPPVSRITGIQCFDSVFTHRCIEWIWDAAKPLNSSNSSDPVMFRLNTHTKSLSCRAAVTSLFLRKAAEVDPAGS